jgi:demethylmenaquinone methyltransferase/2-methoxy-6-polyprenyl-1,4-benzoquinol methylase
MPHYNKNDPESIQAMFSSIAAHYDKANAVLSFQMHRNWNRELVRRAVSPYSPTQLLDLCCGTGEIAYTYLKEANHPCHAHLLDFCKEMLDCAKQKAQQGHFNPIHQLSYIQGDAQAIPLGNQSVGCVTIAYGIRNVEDPIQCASEVFRVLTPGGVFGILELTQPNNRLLRLGHRLYLKGFLPFLGRCLSANQAAYQYLSQSIDTFIQPHVLEQQLRQIGFIETECIPLSGGIATILFAKKPL